MIDPTGTSRNTGKRKPRIALAHDWLVSLRGGEFVLDRLARQYGPTTLYTLVNNGRSMTPAIDACDVRTSRLQRCPGAAGRWRRWYLPLMPWAVERIIVEPCNLLISTSSAVMKSIRPPAGVPHLCYCHSPARYIWEQTEDYAVGSAGQLRRAGLGMLRTRFQAWDRRTATRVTRFLANSNHTAARIKRCYDRDAAVVYPPVRTDYFSPDPSIPRANHLLVVSALEPYKRVDLVIEAAKRVNRPLTIIGDGSQRDALRRIADDRITFLGRTDDEMLLEQYRRAAALVFPQVEDFGITAVEAQAAGCPVIALAAGGALETVTSETGVLFETQTIDHLADAIEHVAERRFDPSRCRANAERFSEARFDQAIQVHVSELLHESAE